MDNMNAKTIKRILIITMILFFGLIVLQAQYSFNATDKLGNVSSKNFPEHDFMKKYNLSNSVPTTMRSIENYTMRSGPGDASDLTQITIPADSIVDAYKYFPNYQSWAVKYHGHWGFVPGDKLFPVSKHTLNMNLYDIPPKLTHRIKPKYPKSAEKKGITGSVVLDAFIDQNGNVKKIKVVKGVPELNEAAIAAIKKAKFKPAIYKGRTIGVWIPVSFDFE